MVVDADVVKESLIVHLDDDTVHTCRNWNTVLPDREQSGRFVRVEPPEMTVQCVQERHDFVLGRHTH